MKRIAFFLAVASFIALAGCNSNYGSEVDHDKLQVYYKDGVTRDEANKLKDYLVKNGFENGKLQTVQILKSGNTYIFKEVLAQGIKIDQKLTQTFSEFATELSADVFNGAPVKIHTCNDKLETVDVFNMLPASAAQSGDAGDWKVYDDGTYTLKYPSTWNVSDQKENTKLMLVSAATRSSFNLITEDLTGKNATLDSYAQSAENLLNTSIKNFKMLDSTSSSSAVGPYKKISYNGENDLGPFFVQQDMWVVGQTAYILTYYTKNTTPTADQVSTANGMASSFVIK